MNDFTAVYAKAIKERQAKDWKCTLSLLCCKAKPPKTTGNNPNFKFQQTKKRFVRSATHTPISPLLCKQAPQNTSENPNFKNREKKKKKCLLPYTLTAAPAAAVHRRNGPTVHQSSAHTARSRRREGYIVNIHPWRASRQPTPPSKHVKTFSGSPYKNTTEPTTTPNTATHLLHPHKLFHHACFFLVLRTRILQ